MASISYRVSAIRNTTLVITHKTAYLQHELATEHVMIIHKKGNNNYNNNNKYVVI